MKDARLVRQLEDWTGDARLYELSEPVEYEDLDEDRTDVTKFVIVSATVASFSGPETYVFPATEDGEVINFLELPGSFRGGLDHKAALVGAGFTVTEEA